MPRLTCGADRMDVSACVAYGDAWGGVVSGDSVFVCVISVCEGVISECICVIGMRKCVISECVCVISVCKCVTS